MFGDFGGFTGTGSRLFYLDANNVIREFDMADETLQSMSMSGIGVDNDGELYVMGNTTGTPFGATGRVLRLSPSTTENETTAGDTTGDNATGDGSSGGGGGSIGIALLSFMLAAGIRSGRRESLDLCSHAICRLPFTGIFRLW